MRDFLGSDFPLMVDANMRLRVDQAICTARALAEYRLVWLEEPTIPDDPLAHGRVAHEGGLPTAAGENLHNPVRVPQSHRRGRYRFFRTRRLQSWWYHDLDESSPFGRSQ
jgi:L-alanine-DL-glutamate epimerase-like enolase superfamily enzyme